MIGTRNRLYLNFRQIRSDCQVRRQLLWLDNVPKSLWIGNIIPSVWELKLNKKKLGEGCALLSGLIAWCYCGSGKSELGPLVSHMLSCPSTFCNEVTEQRTFIRCHYLDTRFSNHERCQKQKSLFIF